MILADNGPCQSAFANASSSPASAFLTACSVVCSATSHGLTAAIDAPPTARPAAPPAARTALAAPLTWKAAALRAALPVTFLPMDFITPRLTNFSATSVSVLRTTARPAVIAPPVAYISAA